VQGWRLDTADSRLNSSYLLLARALMAERRGRPEEGLAILVDTLKPEYDADYGGSRHDWLPQVVRLARAVGDTETEHAAVRTCRADADRFSSSPALARDAQHCRAIVDSDVDLMLDAANYYRSTGRQLNLAQTLEDAAILLAEQGATDRARALLSEAVEVYDGLG